VLSASLDPAALPSPTAGVAGPPSFAEVYDQCFDLAWRNLRRLGASDHRRALRRKSPPADASVDADSLPDEGARDPYDSALREEGVRRLHRLLDELTGDKRVVFVLAELEQMSAPEIAEALGENVNTISARLRAARREFEQLVAREQARDEWRLR